MISDDFLTEKSNNSQGKLTDTQHVFAMMSADEDDTPKFPTSDLQHKLSTAISARANLRDVPTFQGGATNRNAGTYVIPPLTYFHHINRYELLSQKILFTINRNKKNQILLSKEYFKRMGIDINLDYDRHIILIQMILVD